MIQTMSRWAEPNPFLICTLLLFEIKRKRKEMKRILEKKGKGNERTQMEFERKWKGLKGNLHDLKLAFNLTLFECFARWLATREWSAASVDGKSMMSVGWGCFGSGLMRRVSLKVGGGDLCVTPQSHSFGHVEKGYMCSDRQQASAGVGWGGVALGTWRV